MGNEAGLFFTDHTVGGITKDQAITYRLDGKKIQKVRDLVTETG
jgi:hypothetical protein